MFHGVSFRLLHNPPLDQITAMFGRLRQDGADAIAIIPHHYISLQPGTPDLAAPPTGWQPPWYIYPDLGQDAAHPFINTPEPELVLAACKAAAGMGFQVMLKPHVDSYQAGWRGDVAECERQARLCVDERGHWMELGELCLVCFGMYVIEIARGRPLAALASACPGLTERGYRRVARTHGPRR